MSARSSAVLLFAILTACSSDGGYDADALRMAVPTDPSDQIDGIDTTAFAGPGVVCGGAFAIALEPGEVLERYDRQMDFFTYRLFDLERSAVIYEGTAPQEADLVIEAQEKWPTKIALHLKDGGYSKDLSKRVFVRGSFPAVCRNQITSDN
ncbi:hypothetical protein [Alteriqipengyuania sp. 357]